MHHPSLPDQLRPIRPRRATLSAGALLAALSLLTGSPVLAQAIHGTPPPGRLIALQYEDHLATEDATLTVPLPLPSAVEVSHIAYESSGCLDHHGSVPVTAPDATVDLELALPPWPLVDGIGGSCSGNLALRFINGERSWPAEARVTVTRLPELPQLGLPEVSTTFSTDLVLIPRHLLPSHRTKLILLSLANNSAAPLTLLGFGDTAAFTATIGPVYLYDPNSFTHSYGSLLSSAKPLSAIDLAPGEAAHLAIVYDPDQRLPDAGGAITIRPVALVEAAGQLFSVPFPRFSTTWGPESP